VTRTLVLLGCLVLPGSPAMAHTAPSGWHYPPACCSNTDCHPIPCEELLDAKDGGVEYQTPEGFKVFVAKSQVNPSPDAQCHICYSPTPGSDRNGYCAWQHYGN
jgi:hypothetical protein